jgi:membrane protease YdiL (CAAX protease family)
MSDIREQRPGDSEQPSELSAVPVAPVPSVAEPPNPLRNAFVVFMVFFLHFVLLSASRDLLTATGFYRQVYGQEMVDRSAAKDGTDTVLIRTRFGLWMIALAFPFQLVAAPLLFCLSTRTPPQDIGLTPRSLGRNALLGAAGCLALAPVVLAVHWLLVRLYANWPAVQAQEHQLQRLAEQGLSPMEWALWLFTVLVAAPVLEEILFRGVLQTWFRENEYNAWAAWPLALLFALTEREELLRKTAAQGGLVFLEALAPVLFVLLLLPAFVVLRLRQPRSDVPAVYASAVVFAMIHTAAWPSPAALFLLGLGLGALALRTRSLAGPIVLHSLFNGLSVLLFFRMRG